LRPRVVRIQLPATNQRGRCKSSASLRFCCARRQGGRLRTCAACWRGLAPARGSNPAPRYQPTRPVPVIGLASFPLRAKPRRGRTSNLRCSPVGTFDRCALAHVRMVAVDERLQSARDMHSRPSSNSCGAGSSCCGRPACQKAPRPEVEPAPHEPSNPRPTAPPPATPEVDPPFAPQPGAPRPEVHPPR
jgi:hypothetical protein